MLTSFKQGHETDRSARKSTLGDTAILKRNAELFLKSADEWQLIKRLI